MASVAYSPAERTTTWQSSVDDRHGWGFVLLLSLVAILFVRPADLLPAVEGWPIYQATIAACLLVSARSLVRQLTRHELWSHPITACLYLLWLAVGLSHLSHGFIWGMRTSLLEVAKVMALYLVVAGVVNTPRRIYVFTRWLTGVITLVAGLALLDHFGVISIAAVEAIRDHSSMANGQRLWLDRLCGTGIFQDPNDFGLILVTGCILSVAMATRPAAGWPRYLWIAPGCILLLALGMTHSRGAMLSLACSIPAVVCYQRNLRWGMYSLCLLPLLTIGFSSRMTDISALSEGTGQTRVQIWSACLTVFRQYPVFGLGEGLLVDEIDQVAHNSFLHVLAETGLLGGTAFVAAFVAAMLGLWLIRSSQTSDTTESRFERFGLSHLRIYVFALIVAYGVGLLTISRQFVAPTYLLLGLAATCQSVDVKYPSILQIDTRFTATVVGLTVSFVGGVYLFTRLLING